MPSHANTPKISIVVPTHNTRELTASCLASVRDHAGEGVEVVVVDDGSRDGTAELLRHRFPEVEILRNPNAAGFSAAANRGVSKTGGDLLLLLNSDAELTSCALEALARAFAEDDTVGVVGARLEYPDGRPQWSGGGTPGLLWLFLLTSGLGAWLGRLRRRGRLEHRAERRTGSLRQVDWVSGAALAVRRKTWEQAGPMDEGYAFYCQDLDLCTAARQAGWKVVLAPRFRVVHHHGCSIGTAEGAIGHQHPKMLWTDLLRWAHLQRGARWARRARFWMRLGGRIRVTALQLTGSGRRRPYVDALRALKEAATEHKATADAT